jgi:hypothetical protein
MRQLTCYEIDHLLDATGGGAPHYGRLTRHF